MVRIDTTLLGFDGGKWERGSRTYVFKADSKFILLYISFKFFSLTQQQEFCHDEQTIDINSLISGLFSEKNK